VEFTTEQKETFQRDGYIVVSGLFDPDHIKAALAEVDKLTYGSSYAEYLAARQNGGAPTAGAERTQFPTGVRALDSLLESEDYLDGFAACAGTNELSYCNGHLFTRSGPDDARHAPELWQGYHIDDDTCSFLPPSINVFQHSYINSSVMLDDVEEDGAPMHMIPGSHLQLREVMPRLVASGDAIRGQISDIRKIPEFAKPVPVIGKAGDALFYSSLLVHAAVPFINKTKQRSLWSMTLARTDNSSWQKYSHPYQPTERAYGIPFWASTTPRVRTLFGWPAPGDSYYTPETLELLSAWYPGIDLEPYRTALTG
jgi:hypothetical protein